MGFQEELLVEERSDDCDPCRINSTMFEVVDDHGANSGFNEILVLEALSLLQLETQYDFVCL